MKYKKSMRDWRSIGRRWGEYEKKVTVDVDTGEVLESTKNLYYKVISNSEKLKVIKVYGRQQELFAGGDDKRSRDE